MNKIILDDVAVVDSLVDDCLKYEFICNELGVNVLNIDVLKSCDLSLKCNFVDAKIEVCVRVQDSVSFNVYEFINGDCAKAMTKYFLSHDSSVSIYKFNNIDSIKENFICNLDGINSSITYNFKTISVSPQSYDFLVYHNFKNTNSFINANGVSINNGSILFNVSSFIPKDVTGCVASQDNKIINLNDSLCVIKPNLYIECDDVVANHSAWVGCFDDDELFYLQSRGIDLVSANKLLIFGFLVSDMDSSMYDEIRLIIDNYWR